jgi:hypothetical protein
VANTLRAELPACRGAVEAVAAELAVARQDGRPVTANGLSAPSCHELAVDWAGGVLDGLCAAADPLAWCTCLPNPDARFDLTAAVAANPEGVAAYLRGRRPLPERLFAALRLEALRAADRKRLAGQGQGAAAEGTPARPGKRRRAGGRPPLSAEVRERDRRICEELRRRRANGESTEYAHLARDWSQLGLTAREVRLAVDRERHRRRKLPPE